MGTETNKDERNTPEYLAALLKDKKQIQAFPNVFIHLERLLDEGECETTSIRLLVEHQVSKQLWRSFCQVQLVKSQDPLTS